MMDTEKDKKKLIVAIVLAIVLLVVGWLVIKRTLGGGSKVETREGGPTPILEDIPELEQMGR